MEFTVIGTGSTGNCYMLKHDNDTLLLDAGVSMDKIYQALDFNVSRVDAVLCSHGHQDHIKSVDKLLKAYIPVVMSEETQKDLNITSPMLITKNNVTLGNWKIQCFKLEHDSDNTGFLVLHKPTGLKICYITDTGFVKVNPVGVNVLITECNYIEELLGESDNAEIRERVRTSHMSLGRLVSYLEKIDTTQLRQLILVHLSDHNSDENIILDTLKDKLDCKILIPKAKEVIKL